jgi:hypothetical protein
MVRFFVLVSFKDDEEALADVTKVRMVALFEEPPLTPTLSPGVARGEGAGYGNAKR